MRTSTRIGGLDDAPVSARNARGTPGVAHEAAQQTFGLLKLGPVGLPQPGALRIEAPPALEPPQALVRDPEARDTGSGAAQLPRLEVEEALEAGSLAGPVRLAFS